MKLKYKFYFVFLLLLIDLISLNGVFYFSVKMLHIISKTRIQEEYFSHLFVFNLFWFGPSGFFGLYRINKTLSIDQIHRATWKTLVVQQVVLFTYLFIDNNTLFTKDFIMIEASLLIMTFLVLRFVSTIFFYSFGKNTYNDKKSVIIGNNPVGIKLAHYFEKKPLEYNFAGFLDNENLALSLNSINQYFKAAYDKQIEKVYLVINNSFNVDTRELFNLSEKYGIKLKLVNDIEENHFTNFTSTVEDGFQFFSYRIENLEFLTERLKKRLFDIVFSILVLLFLLSWLYPILAIIIKFQSKGPVIFKQIRNGRSNRPFYCYKFRSMRIDNPDDAKQAQKNDSRFTKIGAFMRRTNLDELPQFFNVLIGEMSVVGPRPHMTIHNDKYQKIIEKYLVRNFVKPGITGWAQVNGFRGETKEDDLMEKRVIKDIEYLGSWTLMFDVRIVFLTIYLTFKGDKFAF